MPRPIETRPNGAFSPTVIVKNLIDGVERDASSGERFDARSACDRADLVGTAPSSSAADVTEACKAAGKAFPAWAATPAPARGELIGRLGHAVSRHKETLARVICREIGKTMREARGEVQEVIDTCHFFQSEGRRLYGQTIPSEMPDKELFTYRRPLGVAALITASNFPVAVPSWKVIPALLCGNTVVWKPSQDAPTIGYLFGRLCEDAGVPKGVVNVVHGGVAAGEAVLAAVDAGLVQKVSFTGSTAVGRKIGEVCGRNLQIPSLELGGKNPMVVLRDADVDLAVDGALFAGFGTAGQRCTSLANLILDRPIAEEFTKKYLERVSKIRIGNPTLTEDALYGPLIAERYFDGFLRHYETGKKDGAKLLTSEGRITKKNQPAGFVGDPDAGFYVLPAVWGDVKIGMRLAQEETFGPTVNLITVDGFDEALAAANGTPYGLSSSCYSRDPSAILRFKNGIKAGMTSINNSTSGAEAHMPFGGTGWSGNGTRESGIWVLDAYTRWHGVNMDLAGKLQLAQIDVDLGKAREPTGSLGAGLTVAHNPWHDVELPGNLGDAVPAVIEIPKGSKVKYEIDKRSGLLLVDRVLFSAVHYPANYGFVPRTYCGDGDALDILVLCQEAIVPCAVMRARVIGVMRMRDDKGEDDKLIAVHADDPEQEGIEDISQLATHRLREVKQFFRDYKELEKKTVVIQAPQGRGPAVKILKAAAELYARERERLLELHPPSPPPPPKVPGRRR